MLHTTGIPEQGGPLGHSLPLGNRASGSFENARVKISLSQDFIILISQIIALDTVVFNNCLEI